MSIPLAPDPYDPQPTLWEKHPHLGWALAVFAGTKVMPPANRVAGASMASQRITASRAIKRGHPAPRIPAGVGKVGFTDLLLIRVGVGFYLSICRCNC